MKSSRMHATADEAVRPRRSMLNEPRHCYSSNNARVWDAKRENMMGEEAPSRAGIRVLLYQAAHPEIFLYDDICRLLAYGRRSFRRSAWKELTIHSRHNESDLCRVGCAREMGIDLLGLCLIQRDESVEDIITSSSIVGTTYSPSQTLDPMPGCRSPAALAPWERDFVPS